jgi:hypothetical protein
MIYVFTFSYGLWEFNGTTWRNVPGTIPYDSLTAALLLGLNPRSMVEHEGNLCVGFLYGPMAQWNGDGNWVHMKGVFFPDTIPGTDFGDTTDYTTTPFHLLSHNNILFNSNGVVYRDMKKSLWYHVLANDDSTVWINENAGNVFAWNHPAGAVLEAVGVGDTLFAAVATDRIPCKGAIYKLDLNKCPWYREFKANGYKWE